MAIGYGGSYKFLAF